MQYRKKTGSIKKVLLILLVLFLVIGGFIGYKAWKYFSIGVQVVTNKKIELKQTEEKKVNLLLLGVGGEAHEGPNLTDTIIFATIDPKTKKAVLVSLPRDLWVPELTAKINSAYVYGEEKEKGTGLIMAKAMVEKVLGQPIDYAIKIDFNGFVKAVDNLGGLDITVDRTFDDYAYPVAGKEDELCGHQESEVASLSAQIATGSASESETFPCRYEHLHFDKGNIHLDGESALKYVRSRHALGPEGSDFARSKRQEKIIKAIKDKVFSLDLLLNPVKAIDLVNVIKDSIVTDIKEEEYDDFIKLAQKMQNSDIKSAVIDTGNYEEDRPGLLINPPTGPEYRSQWVLIPAAGNGDYKQIQKYVDCEIKENCITPTPTVLPSHSVTIKLKERISP